MKFRTSSIILAAIIMSAFPTLSQTREADILSTLMESKPTGALDFITATVDGDTLGKSPIPASASDYKEGAGHRGPKHGQGKGAVSVLDFIAGTYSGHGFYSTGVWEPSTSQRRGLVAPPPRMSASYMIPAKWGKISSGFGYRKLFNRMHKGLDFAMPVGDTIRVILPGVVRLVSYEKRGYGLYVVVQHDNGLETRYAHLSSSLTSAGERVEAGQPIALSGNTGNSTGPHLHFETRFNGVAVDPSAVFDFENPRFAPYAPGGKLLAVHNQPTPPSKNSTEKSGKKADQTQKWQNRKSYRVREGDTLLSIAKTTGVPVKRLCKLNHLRKSDKPRVGSLLRLR